MLTVRQERVFITVETLRPWIHVEHIIGPDGSRRGVKSRTVMAAGSQIEVDKFLAGDLIGANKAREISRRSEPF